MALLCTYFWNTFQKSEISLGVSRKFLMTLAMLTSDSGTTILPPMVARSQTALLACKIRSLRTYGIRSIRSYNELQPNITTHFSRCSAFVLILFFPSLFLSLVLLASCFMMAIWVFCSLSLVCLLW